MQKTRKRFGFSDLIKSNHPVDTSDQNPIKGPVNTEGDDIGTGLVVEKARVKPKKPPMYKVLLLNDDYTPMEFVVVLLIKFFGMNTEQAKMVTLHVHTKGVGICGVFPREIAETKVRLVLDFASENQHPLQCTLEQE